MFALSATYKVNPDEADVQINRAQMWQGLVSKAEYAVPFVPAMKDCRILERFENGFFREVELRGEIVRERITFTPDVEVYFERIEPADTGWITNVLSDSEDGLLLTFTFSLVFTGIEPGSDEERQKGEQVRDSYKEAVRATIAETRRRVAAGEI